MTRQAYTPEEKLSGYNTFTTEKSQKGLPSDISREQESALPGGSATPNSPRVEDSAGGDGRVIGKPSFNGPASGEPGPAEHPRTIPAPGDEVPVKLDYGMPTRRTMTGYNAWKPGQRRHKRVGPVKRERHQSYMKNRSRSRTLHKKWHMRNKNKPAFKRRVQLRKRSPNRFKMRFSAYVPGDIFIWFGPAMVDGRVDSVSEGMVTFSPLEGVGADEVYNLSPAAFLAAVVFQTTQDSNEMFEVFDDVLDGSAYDDLTLDDLQDIAHLYGVEMPDVGPSDPDSLADVAAKIVEDAMDGLDAPEGSVSRVATAHLRRAGEVILYDQRSPEEGAWESPDLGGDRPYSQGGPDQYRWDPGAKAPSGGGGLGLPSDAGQWGVGSGKVIPDHLKYAATIGDIESRTSKDVAARARDVRVRLSRADPKQGIWTFKASGSKGNSYTIRVKASRKGNTKEVGKLQVKVSCDCDFFRFQGPEHWARSEGYLYGKPRGTASAPTVMDPGKQHWACKHVLAVLSGHVKKYRVATEELVLPPDTEVVPDFERGASAARVAARYGEPELG